MTDPSAKNVPNDTSTLLKTWQVPGMNAAGATALNAASGTTTLIVGANGAGKSSLGHWLDSNAGATHVQRLIAHRRLWFDSAGPAINSAQRESGRQNALVYSKQPASRYLDHMESMRASIVLFDLLAKYNYRNSKIAQLVDSRVPTATLYDDVEVSPLARLNSILEAAGLTVTLEVTQDATFDAVNSKTHTRYPIFQMSDGEKSALLMAAEVMSAPTRAVLIIDEPERHLHRAISATLIEAVLRDRPDCHFIVLTHDLELAAALPPTSTQTYVVTDCSWSGEKANGWELNLLTDERISEGARRAILGGRKRLLFLEGIQSSLDLRLYRILYPDWSLSAAGSCEQVIRSVTGLRASDYHHWVNPVGIVDADGRSIEEQDALRDKGVLVLPVAEVESLYYHVPVIRAVAAMQAKNLELGRADELADAAIQAALKAVGAPGVAERLAGDVAAEIIRRLLIDGLPSASDLVANGSTDVSVSFSSPYPRIFKEIQTLLQASDLDGLARVAAIRDSPALGRLTKVLHFPTREDYEAAARTLLREDPTLAATLRQLVGPLPKLP